MPATLNIGPNRLPVWHIATRIGFGLLLLICSLYGILAYMPDTYFAFIQAPFQQWLPRLIRLQPVLVLVFVIGLAISLWKLRTTPRDARIAVVFIATNLAAAGWMIATAPFSHLLNDSRSFIWAIVILFPLLWLAIADVQREWQTAVWRVSGPDRLRLWPAAALGAWVGLLIPGTAYLRYSIAGRPVALGPTDCVVWLWTIFTHVLFFVGLIHLINLVRDISTRSSKISAARFVIFTVLAFFAVTLLFRKVINPAVPFAGIEGDIYTIAISCAAVAWIAALKMLWLRRPTSNRKPHHAPEKPRLVFAVLLLSAAFALTAPAFIGVMDWNGILEKLTAVLLWSLVIGLLLPIWPVRDRAAGSIFRPAAWMALLIATYAAGLWVRDHAPSALGVRNQQELRQAFDSHVFLDPSVQVIDQVLAIKREAPCDSLCVYLTQQTNIPASMDVPALDIGLVQELKPTQDPRPNIFIIVVDSLRQDYVSAYNPAVDFTPELEKFAADSVVMRNAFTRYAGTTLSEPSIWTGTMLLHKHFVQPFHALNNLEKMVDIDGYRKFITVDTTLRVLLQPSANTVPLDQDVKTWTDTDLCTTVQDLESKISKTDRFEPIFFFTQPQNIHTIAISSHGSRIHPQRSYDGFNRWIATELERLDGCFGGFLRYLRAHGLYDNSIIVVTADHGEAVKEVGHRRHALAMHPEILRVPLLIHLPKKLLSRVYYDTSGIAFTIDVTPSLFYLLGHRPILNAPELGRPLFTQDKAEHDSYLRDDYLVVSSYGPLYGLLSHNGQALFVENEVERTRQYFDLTSDPWGKDNLITTELAASQGALLRRHVQTIADEYHFQYRPPTLLDWAMR